MADELMASLNSAENKVARCRNNWSVEIFDFCLFFTVHFTKTFQLFLIPGLLFPDTERRGRVGNALRSSSVHLSTIKLLENYETCGLLCLLHDVVHDKHHVARAIIYFM